MPPFLLSLVVGFALAQFATLVTTVYLHRALSHRALALRPPAAMAFRVITWITTGIKPRQWVAVHRKHHASTDVEGDPHSPIIEGFALVQFGNAVLYRRALRDPELVRRYARDLAPDRWDRALFDRAGLGLGIGIVALCVLLGPLLGLVAAVFHTAMYLLLNAAINAIGHSWGRQPFANTARNNQWLALITAGEGLHNNHHAAPTSARLALGRGQIDPGWWLVRILLRTRLAEVRHAETKLKVAA